MTELTRVLTRQIEAEPNSRLLVFTQYRDTIRSILKTLSENAAIRVERFVGQSEREDDPGMTQEQQRESLEKLRNGQVNVLAATSIAEEGLDIPEVDHVVFYEPVPSEIRYIQRRGRTGRRVAGKVSILIAENTLDEAFYWSSIRRAKKMKKLIKQLNKKLPEMLKERKKPLLAQKTLTFLTPQKRRVNPIVARGMKVKAQPEKAQRPELWKPQTFQTKGLSKALKWLVQNLPEDSVTINKLVQQAVKETNIQRPAIETAIWRLIQQGHLYMPELGRIKKL
jgi:Fanconi anemia group M protein